MFVDPTQTAGSTQSSSGTYLQENDHKGLTTGGIAGIVIGVIGAVLIGAGLVLFWLFRRKKLQREQEGYNDDPSVRGSSSGMMGAQRADANSNGVPGSPNSGGNRNSMLQIDPRMDPFQQGLYARNSHESFNTLRDDHDYSRKIQQPPVLRATNPDPVVDD